MFKWGLFYFTVDQLTCQSLVRSFWNRILAMVGQKHRGGLLWETPACATMSVPIETLF